MELIFAAVLIAVFFLFLNLVAAVGGAVQIISGGHLPFLASLPSGKLTAVVDDPSISRVCDTDLLNFLRADSGDNKTFAELAGLTQVDSSVKQKFEDSANSYFNSTYKRGDFAREGWKFSLITQERLSVISIGNLEGPEDPLDTCAQTTPSAKPGEFLVAKLSLDY